MSDIGFFRFGTEDYHIASDAVRTTAQSLSDTEKAQARANIGAPSTTDVEDAMDAIPDVINDLTSDSTTAALSARQGKVLDDKITSLENDSDSEYCKFPDGTLMCWKTESRNNTGSRISYTFPINFISLPTVVITTGAGGERVPIYAEDVSTSGFNVYRTGNGTAAIWIRWLAIGRWK